MANITFKTIAEFKQLTKTTHLDVVRNPNTNKLFVADATNGHKYKCQETLNSTLPMAFIIEDGDVSNACLCNVKTVDNIVFSL